MIVWLLLSEIISVSQAPWIWNEQLASRVEVDETADWDLDRDDQKEQRAATDRVLAKRLIYKAEEEKGKGARQVSDSKSERTKPESSRQLTDINGTREKTESATQSPHDGKKGFEIRFRIACHVPWKRDAPIHSISAIADIVLPISIDLLNGFRIFVSVFAICRRKGCRSVFVPAGRAYRGNGNGNGNRDADHGREGGVHRESIFRPRNRRRRSYQRRRIDGTIRYDSLRGRMRINLPTAYLAKQVLFLYFLPKSIDKVDKIKTRIKSQSSNTIPIENRIRKLEERQKIVDTYLLNKGTRYFDNVCTCSLSCIVRSLKEDSFVRSIIASVALFTFGLKLCTEFDAWYLPIRLS
ncbi:uncharacterized protein LOC143357156 isoform X1 [Halictus rubicundus]|uniref:uncharacterized protein LOC143357156 isoform X1 n=1 Tax=Halictus rubicundus TaxID=77578 RepID=UPI0040360066